MIGLCGNCKDPASELKLRKSDRSVICTNCMLPSPGHSEFFIKMLENQKEFLAEIKGSDALFCWKCEGATPSQLLGDSIEEYKLKCTYCNSIKNITEFSLRAFLEINGKLPKDE